MSAVAAARRLIRAAVWLLFLALCARDRTRGRITGFWRSVGLTRGSASSSITEIKQTDSTVAIRSAIPDGPALQWSVFPTDGTVLKTKMGRHLLERTGEWKTTQLVLRETGPGNAPWRRSTEERILSLSSVDGRMNVKVHNLSDTKFLHDYAIELERVKP